MPGKTQTEVQRTPDQSQIKSIKTNKNQLIYLAFGNGIRRHRIRSKKIGKKSCFFCFEKLVTVTVHRELKFFHINFEVDMRESFSNTTQHIQALIRIKYSTKCAPFNVEKSISISFIFTFTCRLTLEAHINSLPLFSDSNGFFFFEKKMKK